MSKTINITIDSRIILPKYREYLNASADVLLFMGGAGSGKSTFIAQKILFDLLRNKFERVLYCRKVGRTIRNSQYQLFKDLIAKYGLKQLFRTSDTTMEIECIVNGNKAIASGIDDVEKIKSITDITTIWMEEATEFTQNDYEQLKMRMRKRDAKQQMILSFNPVYSWIINYFWIAGKTLDKAVEKKLKYNVELIHSTYKDNPYLPASYVQSIEGLKDYNPYMYNVYAEGIPTLNTQGVVYEYDTNYTISDAVYNYDVTVYGIDFGFNNPTAVVECKVSFKEKKIYVREKMYKTKMVQSELLEWIKTNIKRGSYVVCDIAEPARIADIRNAGYNVLDLDKDIVRGIRTVKEYKLVIDKESTNLIKELQMYSYAYDKKTNQYTELPVKFNDHLLDAMRYAVVGITDAMKNKTNIEIVRI